MVKKRKRVINTPKPETASNDHHQSTSPTPNKNKSIPSTALNNHPYRNLDSLYTSTRTFQCAIGSLSSSSSSSSSSSTPCIPCAYKIAAFDTSLDYEFTQMVRNVRPEMCPRSKQTRGIEGTYGYQNIKSKSKNQTSNLNILTIGDGDFTFTLALARMLLLDCNNNIIKNNSISIVATSYESKYTLQKVYPSIDVTIAELSKFKQVRIAYQVDATRLSETLPSDIIMGMNTKNNNPNNKFDVTTPKPTIQFQRIIWNFPCTAESNGQDGQNNEMEENKMLIQKFVRNCVPFMQNDGHSGGGTCGINSEIHMIHKTKPPYDQWKIEQVALDSWCDHDNSDGKDDMDDAVASPASLSSSCPLEYKGRIVFDKCLLPPYTPRKALDKKSFPCHDACIYVIGLKEKNKEYSGTSNTKGRDDHNIEVVEDDNGCGISMTIPTTNSDCENIDYDIVRENTNRGIIPVTKAMIDKIRNVHLPNAKHGHGHIHSVKKTKKKRKKRR